MLVPQLMFIFASQVKKIKQQPNIFSTMKLLLLSIILLPLFTFSQINGVYTESALNGLIDNLNIKLYSIQSGGAKVETDGVRAKFGSTYCACIDGNDAPKFMGSGIENISLMRDGVSLAIEARPYISYFDTLFINMEGMNIGGNYEFQTTAVNFDTSIASCLLIDKFLNISTPISFTDTTRISFNVTTDTNSYVSDRFYVVLATPVALPLSKINLKTQSSNNIAILNWETNAENDIKFFEIEKLAKASNYITLGKIVAKNGVKINQYQFNVFLENETIDYYRIKAIKAGNKILYSNVAKVINSNKKIVEMIVYPNPINSNTCNIQFKNMSAGNYKAQLFSLGGQEVWNDNILYDGNTARFNLQLNKNLIKGVYLLQLTNRLGNKTQQKIIVN
jgi:hypothetical protein